MIVVGYLLAVLLAASLAAAIARSAITTMRWLRKPAPLWIALTTPGFKTIRAAAGDMILRGFGFSALFKTRPVFWICVAGFHYSLFFTIAGHLILVAYPVTEGINFLFSIAGIAGWLLLGFSLALLTFRLVTISGVWVNRLTDYIALLLLICISFTGLWMRTAGSVWLPDAKAFAMGAWRLHPAPPPPSVVFYLHLILIAVFLIHMAIRGSKHSLAIFANPVVTQLHDIREKRISTAWDPEEGA